MVTQCSLCFILILIYWITLFQLHIVRVEFGILNSARRSLSTKKARKSTIEMKQSELIWLNFLSKLSQHLHCIWCSLIWVRNELSMKLNSKCSWTLLWTISLESFQFKYQHIKWFIMKHFSSPLVSSRQIEMTPIRVDYIKLWFKMCDIKINYSSGRRSLEKMQIWKSSRTRKFK